MTVELRLAPTPAMPRQLVIKTLGSTTGLCAHATVFIKDMPVSIAFGIIQRMDDARVNMLTLDLWLGHVGFDVTREEIARIIATFGPLGLNIEDCSR